MTMLHLSYTYLKNEQHGIAIPWKILQNNNQYNIISM